MRHGAVVGPVVALDYFLASLSLARFPFFPSPANSLRLPLACNKTFIRVTREPLSRVKCICLAFRGKALLRAVRGRN